MFNVTQVGSWPRSEKLLRALEDRRKGQMTRAQLDRIADDEVRRCVEAQLEAGVDIVVDGEQRRDSFAASQLHWSRRCAALRSEALAQTGTATDCQRWPRREPAHPGQIAS